MNRAWLWMPLGLGLSLAACANETEMDPTDKEEVPPAVGKGDAWNATNDPSAFQIPLRTRLDELPAEGRADVIPWSETYWPTTDDGINARWNGPRELSPLEKYDMAFNGWVPPAGFFDLRPLTSDSCRTGTWDPQYYAQLGPAARHWSDSEKGNGRARNGRDDDGDGRVDECDDLDGMEGWWGSCHAWTPASILEREPLEAVEINGVRFYPSDIKALIILMYDESRQIAIGDRCQLDQPPRDANGRITDDACRNTNAGAFHLLITNLLGLRHQSFGEDRVAGMQVWNQPFAGYRITTQREVTEAEALRLLGRSETEYTFNTRAERFVEVAIDVDYVVETHASTQPSTPIIQQFVRKDDYRYVLELDADGDVIGGEWINGRTGAAWAGDADRPDYLWLPLGPGRMINPHVRVADIRQLHRQSRPETRMQQVLAFRKDENRVVPDIDWRGIRSRIEIPNDVIAEHVTVNVNIAHSWIYDLSVRLHRNGREIILFNRNPRGTSTSLVASFPIDELAGESAAGVWELQVADHDGRNTGRLFDWGIEITAQAPTPPPPPPPPAGPRTYTSPADALDIPDADTNGVVSTLAVPDDLDAATVTLALNIAHTYRGDLRVVLERNGVRRVLHDRTGGGTDDLALEGINVSELAGPSIAGEWRLIVSDHARRDTGRLVGWSITAQPR